MPKFNKSKGLADSLLSQMPMVEERKGKIQRKRT